MNRKMILALSILAVVCISKQSIAKPAPNLPKETTEYLCQALGYVSAGGLGMNEFSTTHLTNIADEISSRKDWNQETCAKLFNQGAADAAMQNLGDVLGD